MALNDIVVPKENSGGTFDEVVLTGAQIGLEKPATGNASSTQVVLGNDTRLSDSRSPSAHAASHAAGGSDPLAPSDIGLGATDDVAFNEITVGDPEEQATIIDDSSIDTANWKYAGTQVVGAEERALYDQSGILRASFGSGESGIEVEGPISFSGEGAATNAATTLTNLGAASDDHTHGNITNDGKVGSTSGLPLVTTTAGAVTTLALGTAGQVLTVNSGANGVEFAAAAGGGSSIMQSIAVGFVLN